MFVYLLSDRGQAVIKNNKRSYGNNLDKFEPGDLNESLCPNNDQFERIEAWEAAKVLELAHKNEKMAIELSNKLMDRILGSAKTESAVG